MIESDRALAKVVGAVSISSIDCNREKSPGRTETQFIYIDVTQCFKENTGVREALEGLGES